MTKIAAPLAGSSRIRMSSQPWLRTMKTTTKNDNDKSEEDDATKTPKETDKHDVVGSDTDSKGELVTIRF